MKNINLVILFSCILLCLILSCCVDYAPPQTNIHSDNYSASFSSQKPSNAETTISEKDTVNVALSSNPEYKVKQLKTVSAESDYYSSLGKLSPDVSVNKSKTNVNYEASGSNAMNVLSAKAVSNETRYDADDYRRELIKNVRVNNNEIEKSKTFATIQEENEKFQNKMVSNATDKHRHSNASASDILNFKIKELNAKAASIEADRKHKTKSYALAAKMGIPTAELPKNLNTENNTSKTKLKNRDLNLNYYLDLAIKNRPDLKAAKEALKAGRYKLYSAGGALLPTLNATSGNANNISINSNFTGGQKIAKIRSEDAKYNARQEALNKKWISVVQEVKKEYVSLKAQLAVQKILTNTMHLSEQRRNIIANQYNKGIENIAVLNQAQSNFVKAQESFAKAERDVRNARSRLSAACGIDPDESKNNSVTTLNQGQ